MKQGYTTWGPVCMDCGHIHRTIEAAERCLRRHQRGCRMQGGYSDRHIVRVPLNWDRQYDVTRGPSF